MPPKTRSGGAAPPSRVYHETPSLRQLQFSSRKKATYGRKGRVASAQKQRLQKLIDEEDGDQEPESTPASKGKTGLKQQTLTQIQFVSSLEDNDGFVISDSEEDDFSEEKENEDPDQDDEDEAPRASGRKRKSPQTSKDKKTKRRRTLGDENEEGDKNKGKGRRKTLGDKPVASNYHTQTLTQFIGRDKALIQDSEDEENIEDDEFTAWLPGELHSPEKQHGGDRGKEQGAASRSREHSVVPQTPAKRIRFEIPSSSQLSTPATPSLSNPHMLERYGRAGAVQNSPLSQHSLPVEEAGEIRTVTPRKKVVEIKDSYSTEASPAPTPSNTRSPFKVLFSARTPSVATSSDVGDAVGTPSKSRVRNFSAELGDDVTPKASKTTKRVSPQKSKALAEIPDSDEDDFSCEDEGGEDGSEKAPSNLPQLQRQPTEEQSDKENSAPQVVKVLTIEKEEVVVEHGHQAEEASLDEDDDYAAGADTQFALNELETTIDSLCTPTLSAPTPAPALSTTLSAATPSTATVAPTPGGPSTPAKSALQHQPAPGPSKKLTPNKTPTPKTKPLRKPIRRTLPAQSQIRFLESQRVPLTTIQAWGTPTYRTDVLLPIPAIPLSRLISGHALSLTLAHKIPAQVVRFWLFSNKTLRYVACVDGITSKGENWEYAAGQVYELNNPVDEQEMLDDGWLDEHITKYKYIPPAVVSQLLSNLRHALFGDGTEALDEDDSLQPSQAEDELPPSQPAHPSSFSVSQAVEAQLQSDILHSAGSHHADADAPAEEDEERIPSTPLTGKGAKAAALTTPKAIPFPGVRASQATTASQVSTIAPETQEEEPRPDKEAQPQSCHAPPPPPPPPESSSPTFQHIPYDEESSPLFGSARPGRAGMSSQLLSRSQMLPDSLVKDDDVMLPPRRG